MIKLFLNICCTCHDLSLTNKRYGSVCPNCGSRILSHAKPVLLQELLKESELNCLLQVGVITEQQKQSYISAANNIVSQPNDNSSELGEKPVRNGADMPAHGQNKDVKDNTAHIINDETSPSEQRTTIEQRKERES